MKIDSKNQNLNKSKNKELEIKLNNADQLYKNNKQAIDSYQSNQELIRKQELQIKQLEQELKDVKSKCTKFELALDVLTDKLKK